MLRLDTLSPSLSLSFSYKASSAGQRFLIRLRNTLPAGGASFLIETKDAEWHELCVGFPPLQGPTVFQALSPMARPLQSAGALEIEALPSSSPTFQIQLAEIRFDPPAYESDAAVVAAAMGCSLARAKEARGLNLPEMISWAIMRLSEKCNCPPSEIYAKRKTMSWGEMAQDQGLRFEDLLADISARASAAGIQAQDPTPEQTLKSMRNDAGVGEER